MIISGFRDRGMWPFNDELILKLAEKEWLGKCNLKEDKRSIMVLEAQKIMLELFTDKQKKVETKRV